MSLVKAEGKIFVEKGKNDRGRVVVNVSNDFSNYYNWFITRKYWVSLGTPMFKPHITLANSKFHTDIDWKKALRWNNKPVEFEYDVDMIQGGFLKGFIMFYIKVFSQELDNIKNDIGIVEGPNYKGLHITIANSKGTNMQPYWPKMLEIKV